ncbi:MAG: hypothetical protein VKJ64_21410 [Leptolyngbyaceae bacterium]|nr:hypothetical protein [Leptolyngbyaceae bacterium]
MNGFDRFTAMTFNDTKTSLFGEKNMTEENKTPDVELSDDQLQDVAGGLSGRSADDFQEGLGNKGISGTTKEEFEAGLGNKLSGESKESFEEGLGNR